MVHRSCVGWYGVARVVLLIAVSVGGLQRTDGKDFFITIGGGYGPTSNQVSLERNVMFFQRFLGKHGPEHPEHSVFFSDGGDPRRDVQYRDLQSRGSVAEGMLAEIFGDPDELSLKYRNHEIESALSPARKLPLRRHLVRIGRQAQPGDRVFLYVTGHGASSDDERNEHNSVLHLWGDDEMSVSELSRLLDRFPQQVQVVLVMVQCHSGGFAHVIFDRADADLGLSPRLRVGFFSQVHDRVSAGCTADANEEDYQEYSSYFWAALGAETRTGQTIPRVDYDQDGLTSLAEAHAYATIESHTVDIPIRTSDALLWQYSRAAKRKQGELLELEGDEPSSLTRLLRELAPKARREPPSDALLPLGGTFDELSAVADPVDRAILLGLASKLELSLDTDVQDLKKRLRKAKAAIEHAELQQSEALLRYLGVRAELRDEVIRQWPELDGTITPTLTALLSTDTQQLVDFVESQDDYRVLIRARKRMEQCAAEVLEAEKQEAQWRRLQRITRRIVLAKNLPRVASADVVNHYRRLLAAEQSTFGSDSH